MTAKAPDVKGGARTEPAERGKTRIMKAMSLWSGALLAVATAGILVAGCGPSGGGFSEREKAANEGSNAFRYPIPTSPTTLDPARVEDGDTIDFLQQVYEGLVGWNEKNEVVPILAESWEILEDGKVYKFTLREGVKFHNGKVLTSEDVKWSIERAANPKIQSAVAGSYMGDIVGLKDVVDGKATTISGIETPDPRTVIIRLDKPRPYFLGKFTYLCSAILPKDAVPVDRPISKAEEMIGTGPFRVTEFVPEQVVKMEAFADYHGGAPKVARIERPVVKDAVTRLSMFKTGEVDLVGLERQDVAGIQADPKLKDQLSFFDRPAIWYIGMNPQQYAPFKDVRVRKAFSMAIDREQIVNEVLGGINKVATSVVPPGVKGHRPQGSAYTFNVAEAKRLLAEAGYPNGQGMPPLEFWFRDNRPDIKLVAEAVASQLEKNLGVKPKLSVKEWGFYLEARNRGEIPFFHMRWAADYLDPENFVSFFFSSTGAENKVAYKNAEVDALTARADTMPDGEERIKLYQQAEDIALREAAMIPIYFQRDAELISPRVKGLRKSIFGHLPHTTVSVE